MPQVGANIRQARERSGISQRRLAARTGLSPQFISDIERGRTPPSIKTLKLIAEVLNVPPAALMEETGLPGETPQVAKVPLLGRVPAGSPVLSEEIFEDEIPLPRQWVKEPSFLLKARGTSMVDVGIEDGDLVLVRCQPAAENGQVVIARINGEVTCKRFYRSGPEVILEPANPGFKPLRYQAADVEIVGIVTHIIKTLS
ncbi:transcriptional repressor LexA [Desulforudis sp. 1088]|uniref:transcriptional repressor LexA n=1 Tax=unclassified Candidatus Desulforudis TaxID=2635950 RepID=UPI0034937416